MTEPSRCGLTVRIAYFRQLLEVLDVYKLYVISLRCRNKHIVIRCTNTVSSQWGLSLPAVNEYKTYSDAQVKVYKDDQLVLSTDTSVSAQQLLLLTALLTFS